MRFALFRTASSDPTLAETGAALDVVIHEELSTLSHIEVSARPSVDLPAMQLAIDCVGEVPECMQAVIQQAGVDALIAPVLRRDGDESVTVTLIYFEAGDVDMRSVTRTLSGRNVTQAILDAIPEMVREAFGLPEPVVAAPATEQTKDALPQASPHAESAPTDKRARRLQIVVPTVLGAAGAVIAGVGLGLGIAANNEEDAYARAPTHTPAEVDAALASYDRAKRLALAANVSFGVAGAAVLSGLGVWLFTRHTTNKGGSQLTLTPDMSPSRFVLSLQRGF